MRVSEILAWVLLLTCTAGSFPLHLPAKSVQSGAYTEALEAHRAGNREKAVTLLRQVLRERPEFPEARFELGMLLMEQKQWREAEAEFRTFLALRPGSYEAHNNLAVIYAELADDESLERELLEVTRLRPAYTQGHVNLGDYYLSLALRSLWKGYLKSSGDEKGKLRTRILKFLSADPASTEDRFVEEKIARIAADVVPSALAKGAAAPAGRYEIQVYSARARPAADAFRRKLRAAGFSADLVEVVLDGTTWYRVRIGGFPSLQAASSVARDLVAKALVKEFWIIP